MKQTRTDREAVQAGVVTILEEMTSKWERAFDTKIGSETLLAADLGLDSMQLVQLVGKIEKYFKLKSLPFYKLLLSEERASYDLSVADVVDFMERILNEQARN